MIKLSADYAIFQSVFFRLKYLWVSTARITKTTAAIKIDIVVSGGILCPVPNAINPKSKSARSNNWKCYNKSPPCEVYVHFLYLSTELSVYTSLSTKPAQFLPTWVFAFERGFRSRVVSPTPNALKIRKRWITRQPRLTQIHCYLPCMSTAFLFCILSSPPLLLLTSNRLYCVLVFHLKIWLINCQMLKSRLGVDTLYNANHQAGGQSRGSLS